MPFIDMTSHRLHYRLDGREGQPWLTFCNSLGTDLHMWDDQVAALGDDFRILRYDRRGHGASTAPPPPYAMADLGTDVLALWDALGIEASHFCGLSIGGLTGQWLALEAPQRLQRAVLCATAASIGTPEGWRDRIEQVEHEGLTPLMEDTVRRWFRPEFVQLHPQHVDMVMASFISTAPEAYIGCCAAVSGADFHARLDQITVPLLAVAGSEDPVCPPNDLRQIAYAAPDGDFAQVDGRHLCNMESPTAFNRLVRDFLR